MILVGLAGCLSTGERTPTSGLPPSLGSVPETVPLEASDCIATVLAILVDREHTDAFLPPGFHPRDPQDFFDIPVATGQAMAFLIVVTCPATEVAPDGFEMAIASIFVESPAIPQVADPAHYDFYTLDHMFPREGNLAGYAATWGWAWTPATNTLTLPGGLDATAITRVDSPDGTLLASFRSTFPAPVDNPPEQVRFWHDGHLGIGHITTTLTTIPDAGPTDCNLNPGTRIAKLLGGNTCPPLAALAARFSSFDLSAEVVHMPGVRVA